MLSLNLGLLPDYIDGLLSGGVGVRGGGAGQDAGGLKVQPCLIELLVGVPVGRVGVGVGVGRGLVGVVGGVGDLALHVRLGAGVGLVGGLPQVVLLRGGRLLAGGAHALALDHFAFLVRGLRHGSPFVEGLGGLGWLAAGGTGRELGLKSLNFKLKLFLVFLLRCFVRLNCVFGISCHCAGRHGLIHVHSAAALVQFLGPSLAAALEAALACVVGVDGVEVAALRAGLEGRAHPALVNQMVSGCYVVMTVSF